LRAALAGKRKVLGEYERLKKTSSTEATPKRERGFEGMPIASSGIPSRPSWKEKKAERGMPAENRRGPDQEIRRPVRADHTTWLGARKASEGRNGEKKKGRFTCPCRGMANRIR